jgi:hypothetical protein
MFSWGLPEIVNHAADTIFSPAPTTPAKFDFSVRGWDPLQETRDDCIKRVLKQVRDELETQLDQAQALYEKVVGFQPAPRVKAEEHFDWLARFQILGLPYRQIGLQATDERRTTSVIQGVEEAAELVIGPGWRQWLRPSERGRPPKA